MTDSNTSKAGRIVRSIKRHLFNYLFIALFGSILLIVASAAVKAVLVKSPLEKAESFMTANRFNELVELIESSSRWEPLFPALKPRRERIAVQCYARTGNLPKAMGIADAMVAMPPERMAAMDYIRNFLPSNHEMNTVDKFAHIIKQLEIPPAAAMNLVFKQQNAKLSIDSWSGYNDLSIELKSSGNIDALSKLLTTARTYHPDSVFVKELSLYMEEAQRLAAQGKKIPPPVKQSIPDEDAPFGWAVVRSETAALYDGTGTFLQQVSRGTLIEIDEMRDSKSGQIARGSLYTRSGKTPGIVILAKDITLKRGLIFELDEQNLDSLLKRAELTLQIKEAEASAKAQQAARNPHYAEFVSTRKEYQEFWSKVTDLTEKHKTATGVERENYFEQLRMMKGKDIVLGNKMKDVKRRHEEWTAANADSSPADSPQLTALRNQLQQIENQLQQNGLL